MRRQCLNVRLGVQDHLSISMCRIWARTVFELFKAPFFIYPLYYDEREALWEKGGKEAKFLSWPEAKDKGGFRSIWKRWVTTSEKKSFLGRWKWFANPKHSSICVRFGTQQSDFTLYSSEFHAIRDPLSDLKMMGIIKQGWQDQFKKDSLQS